MKIVIEEAKKFVQEQRGDAGKPFIKYLPDNSHIAIAAGMEQAKTLYQQGRIRAQVYGALRTAQRESKADKGEASEQELWGQVFLRIWNENVFDEYSYYRREVESQGGKL